jgi:dienelactone hydrolase
MMRSVALLLLVVGLTACGGAMAEEPMKVINTETVEYRHGEALLEGFVGAPAGSGARPGVLVVHAWKGIGDHERETVKRLASQGYVAFALDMYGKGIRPKTNQEAAKQAGIYRGNRALMRARARAGLDWLKKHPRVDPKKTVALGYCFGGGTVLELARSGADVLGVVSFHGNLDTPDPADAKNIKASVLVLHGAADPHVPKSQVDAFISEMSAADVDWQLTMYGGAVHSFTHEDAGNDPSRGVAYDAKAARRAYAAMDDFFRELLK